jgi:protein phosphatase
MPGPCAHEIGLLGSRSERGRIRRQNEDALGSFADLGLWVIADGIGGAARGALASELAVESIAAEIRRRSGLVEALLMAHRALLRVRQPAGEPRLGATVVAARMDGSKYEIAWVGDSRAYRCNTGIDRLTKDHSYVQRLVDEGKLTEAAARRHPKRNTITQAIGAGAFEPRPGHIHGELRHDETLLLCSDGLTRELEDEEIFAALSSQRRPQARVDCLIEQANARGGHDNVTVILLGYAAAHG